MSTVTLVRFKRVCSKRWFRIAHSIAEVFQLLTESRSACSSNATETRIGWVSGTISGTGWPVQRRRLIDVEVVAGDDLATVYRLNLLEQHVFRVPVRRATESRPMIKNEQPGPRSASDLRQLD
jgi:hypothetical protein